MEIPGASCQPAPACMDSPSSLSQCPGQQAECPPSDPASGIKPLHFSSDATYPDVRATIITTAVEQTSSHVPGQALGSGVKAHTTFDGQDQVTSTALGKRPSHSWARDSSDALATTARGSWLAALQEDNDQQHSSGPTHLGLPPGRCDALVSAAAHSLEQEIVTAQAAELPSRRYSSTSSPVLALGHGFSSSSSRGSTSSRPAPKFTAFLLIDEDLPPLAHAKSVSPKASSIGKRVNITCSVSNHPADSMPVHQAQQFPDQGLHQPAGPGSALCPGPSDSIVENGVLEPPRQPASSLLVSPFAMAGMKSILGKKGSMVGLQSQRSAPAPTQHLLRAGSADAIPDLSHSRTSRLARAGSAASSVFCVEGGPFAAVALKRAATTGMELQHRLSHEPPTVSSHASYGSELSYPDPSTPLPCDATARTAVQQEGLRGRCSLQPPPPLDDEAEDALNSFLRDRCDAVSNYPSIEADTTLTTTTDVGSTQTMAPAWHAGVSFKLEEGYMEEEEGALAEAVAAEATEQEVQEEETVAQGGGDSDEDYSFDENDDDEDGTTTVMPASRSELAAARLQISKLQEELGEQKALNSGLRGELRKFTALAARLTAQLQPDKAGTAQAAAGAATATVVSVASSECDAPVHAAMAQAAGPAPAVVCSMTTSHMEFPGTPAGAGPEAAAGAGEESGLKPWNRLALYREFLASSADLACGTMKEELLAAQEVLHGKAEFEPSSEQLFLSQLQKVLAMGANAARLLSLQQQELE